jgi:hypothetical protein
VSHPFEASAEALMRQLEHQQQTIERSMRSAGAVTATATSPDHSVKVTLNHLGHLTELTFAGGRYRTMAPAELSKVIIDTIAGARTELLGQLSGAYLAMAPASLDVRSVMSGDFDVAKVMRDMVEERVAAHESMFATLKESRGETRSAEQEGNHGDATRR